MLDALRAYLAERPLVDGLGPLGRRIARQAYQGRFATALMLAGGLHVSLTAAILLLRLQHPGEYLPPSPFAPPYIIELLPSIHQLAEAPKPPGGPAGPIEFKAPKEGVPIPVPEPEAESQTIKSDSQIGIPGVDDLVGIGDDAPTGGGNGTGTGTGVPESVPPPERPDPNVFQNVEKMPVLVEGPPPAYPELARLSQLEGTVIVRALVGRDGKVKETILAKGVNDILDQAAVKATMGYVFVPAMQNGKPVAVWVTIPFRFALH